MANEKNQPVFKTKLGRVHLALFQNRSAKSTWYSISLHRVYVLDGEFKRVSSFPDDEFDNLKLAIERAQKFIAQNRG